MDPSQLTDAAATTGFAFGASDVMQILLILLLVLLNGFFVAAEFAIVKVRSNTVGELAQAGNRRAQMASRILEHTNAYLSASQLGITISSIMLGAVGAGFIQERILAPALGPMDWLSPSTQTVLAFIVGTGIIIFLHVLLGELAPKSLAIHRPVVTTLWISYPLRLFYVLLYPVIVTLNAIANWLLRLVGLHSSANGQEIGHSEEDLRLMVSESQRIGHITRDKLDLLENIFDFSDVTVRQIMVPRVEVAVFDLQKSLGENLAVAERTAHSRYPLVDATLDHVVGIIHMKDLFWQLKELEMSPQEAAAAAERRNPMIAGGDMNKKPPASGAQFLTAIARPVLFVPETAKINTLLQEFQARRIHMAMVVDEYGSSTGLVTFENIIEEIVGEVQDEFDQEVPRIQKIADDEYMVEGITPLDDINDELGLNLESEDADTIGGFLLSEVGRFPKPGDRLVVPPLEIMVRELRRQRIHRVQLRFLTEEELQELEPQETEEPESEESDDTLF